MPSNSELAVHLFFQLAAILVTCQVVGCLLRLLGQTQVFGEMVSGVLLGPSLLGLIAPGVQQFLFPTTLTLSAGEGSVTVTHPSMVILYAMSQVGLVLYMFLIGLQLNLDLLSKHLKHAANISLSGVTAPLVVGGFLGFALSADPAFFAGKVAPWQAALFLGSAMAITAFPMLARIIHESGMANSRIGTLALSAAAMDDAAAWALLAIVLATMQDAPAIAILAIGGGGVYAAAMVAVGRPLFRRLFARAVASDDELRVGVLAMLLLILMLCAWFTDVVGIYAIFGAFIAGVAMPRGQFALTTTRLLEPLTVAVLLPLFFVFSGLNTQMALLIEPTLFWIAVAIIALAFACKGGACFLATRLAGINWREAASLGALMNARGLMELILINIGLGRGLISPALFTILVLMAIVTTAAASPLFRLFHAPERRQPTGVAATGLLPPLVSR